MGPDGVIENRAVELTAVRIQQYLNLGGFGMIKTGRAKIDTPKKKCPFPGKPAKTWA